MQGSLLHLWRRAPRCAAGLLLALAAGLGAGPALAQSAGETKARACAVCHGALGIAVAPEAPNLAGQPEHYLTAQLRAYRSGARQHAVMNVIAKPLEDQDIADLSAWFSSIKVEASRPR